MNFLTLWDGSLTSKTQSSTKGAQLRVFITPLSFLI